MAASLEALTLPPHVEMRAVPRELRLGVGELTADRYAILGRLPSNRFTEVFRATDEQFDDQVALKVFYEPDMSLRQRVDRELEAHLLMDGEDGIVPLRDLGVLAKDGVERRYSVTEFARGGTFYQRQKEQPKDVDLVVDMALGILPPLKAMHRRGIVHRDVTGTNILAREADGEWELTDFGVVETEDPDKVPIVSDLGALAVRDEGITAEEPDGTKGFMAPEIFDDGELTGPEADVFSLAVVMYQGATGRLPFESATLEGYKLAVIRESPASMRSINLAVSAELSDLTGECLRRDPEDRPTAEEFEARLQAIQR